VLDESAIVARLRAAGCVFAEDEAQLLLDSATSDAELDAMLLAREAGRPLEQILGWAQFCGLRLTMAPGVFVPRRRTELLVREAAALLKPGMVVVDLCCGSGAIGRAIATAVAGIDLHASDIDAVAAACARENLAPVGGVVHVGDLFAPLPHALRGRIDVVVANAPYVPTDAIALMPPEARVHERRVALDGGVDGLEVARRIAAAAPSWLAPHGALLIEASAAQADALSATVADAGLAARVVHDDDLDATVVIGRG
jgi:release factor glutamine methyltransferase